MDNYGFSIDKIGYVCYNEDVTIKKIGYDIARGGLVATDAPFTGAKVAALVAVHIKKGGHIMKEFLTKMTTVVLALALSLMPVDLAVAAENDSTVADGTGVTNPDDSSTGEGTDEGDSSDPEEVHYWDHYSWDDTYHMLVCKCGVENCPLAGSDSRDEHTLGEWCIAKAPTTTEEGLRNRGCWCGYTQEETIPKIVEEKPEEKPGEKPEEKPDPGKDPDGSESGDNSGSGENPGEKPEEPDPGKNPEEPKPEEKPDEPKPGEKPEEPAKPGESGGNGSGSNNNGGSSTPSNPAPVAPVCPTTPSVPSTPTMPVKPTTPAAVVTPAAIVTSPAMLVTTILPMRMRQVTVNESKVVKAGKKAKLQVKYNGVVVKGLTWKTSNKKHATVNKNGVVMAKKTGRGKTVKITATGWCRSGHRIVRVKVVFKIKIK